MRKSIKFLSFIICFATVFSLITIKSENVVDASENKYIRIALYHDVSSLSSSGSRESVQVSALKGVTFGFISNGTFSELYTSPSAERYTVQASSENSYDIQLFDQSGNQILIFDSRTGNFQAKPREENDPQIIRLGDYYRGIFEFRRYSNYSPGLLTVINEVNVEDYLYGVVPKEIEAYSSKEALKAQAVAARTYAYKHLDSPKSPYSRIGANLSDGTDCQVYYGYAQVNKITGALIKVEQSSTNLAVDQTKNKTIKYNGVYIYAYYSSSNGGYTEASENVWYSSVPYLKANPDYNEYTGSSRYYWERTFTSSDLRNIVTSKTNGTKDIGNVTKVEIIERAESGRPINIRLTGPLGTHSFYKSECRTAFSLNGQLYDIVNTTGFKNTSVISGYDDQVTSIEPSTLYVMNATGVKVKVSKTSVINGAAVFRTFENVSSSASSFTFVGRGWGHGIGMSQDGAKGMAEKGYTYIEILAFYYPGTIVN